MTFWIYMVTKKETQEIKEAVSDEEDLDNKKIKKKDDKDFQLTDLPGIGPAAAAKLDSAGIYDLMALAVMNPSELSDTSGVSQAVARKAIQCARDMLDLGFQDGVEYSKRRDIKTYSSPINATKNGESLSYKSLKINPFSSHLCQKLLEII